MFKNLTAQPIHVLSYATRTCKVIEIKALYKTRGKSARICRRSTLQHDENIIPPLFLLTSFKRRFDLLSTYSLKRKQSIGIINVMINSMYCIGFD